MLIYTRGGDEMGITLRRAMIEDRQQILDVEAKATRNLRYLGQVFEQWVADDEGHLSVAEIDGELTGVGKFTVMPDGSAWLEALRVSPERQGLGIGKRFYELFLSTARQKGIRTLRMYTGVKNAVSKGLAERFGFHLAATYRGAWQPVAAGCTQCPQFTKVTDPERAAALIMPHAERWTGFMVMNRTFMSINPATCAALAREGKVYEEAASGSLIVIGARFMPEQALHVALFSGDEGACIEFARCQAAELGVPKLQCMFPPTAQDIQKTLLSQGFQLEESDCIVMEVHL
ncbi:MAG: GNAT family N-acetyltransferase [Bacillota bacterium]